MNTLVGKTVTFNDVDGDFPELKGKECLVLEYCPEESRTPEFDHGNYYIVSFIVDGEDKSFPAYPWELTESERQ